MYGMRQLALVSLQLPALGLPDGPSGCLVRHLHSICAGLPGCAGPLVSYRLLDFVHAYYIQ